MNESSNSAPLTPICKRWILHRKFPSFISYDVIMYNSRNMYKHIVPYLATLYTSDVVYSKWSTVIVETIMHVIIIYLHYYNAFAIYYLFQPVNLKGCPYPYVIRATETLDGYIIKIHIEMPYSNKAKGAICTAIRQAAIKIYTMIEALSGRKTYLLLLCMRLQNVIRVYLKFTICLSMKHLHRLGAYQLTYTVVNRIL